MRQPAYFESPMDLRWGEMDAFGHLNNVTYFRYFEEARARWLETLGVQLSMEDDGPVLVQSGATYLRPIHYPAILMVRCYPHEIGRTSFTIRHEIRLQGDEDTIYTEGFGKIVWMSRLTGRPTPVPDRVRCCFPDATHAP